MSADETSEAVRRVVVVGSGTRFLSGISVYTVRLANALAERHQVGLITMRRLIPTRLYPGWRRVGTNLTQLERDDRVAHYDGVDWYWLPSIVRAAWFMARQRPHVVVFQWWTGTVVHSYVALALIARLLRARIVVEFHEVMAVEELGMRLAYRYVKAVVPIFMRLADGFAVHSDYDRALVRQTWRVGERRPIGIVPVGPFDHYQSTASGDEALREAPADATNLLFFGVIRPYKGLQDLVLAFEMLDDDGAFWLTVVGETWEGWTEPVDMIERSPRRARMTLINRYVSDAELHRHLSGADAVVLPYVRSSLSGPLHVAMGYGLPIVISDVGGNVEAAEGYQGLVLVPPGDAAGIATGLRRVAELRGHRFEPPHSWGHTADAFERLFEAL